MSIKKLTRSIVAAVATLVMAFAVATPAFALTEGDLNGGTITINDAIPQQTYNIYQVLYIESYNAESGAYAYKANSVWAEWVADQTQYVTVDEQGYVTWKEGANAADFAKAALTHAKDALIGPDGTQSAPVAEEGEQYSTVTFGNLKLGYYLVDSSAGALCSLDTTNPSAIINEKNEVPEVAKVVKADGSEEEASDKNTVSVGDVLDYTITITAQPGAEGYVLHDELSDGLTLDENSIAVEGLTADEDYTLSTSAHEDGCDFEITFDKDYLDTIINETTITVTYKATVNENAVIGTDANTNEAVLDYGDNSHTTPAVTKTYVYDFTISKVDGKTMNALTGAAFSLYESNEGGTPIELVDEDNGTYRVATADDETTTTTIAVNAEGKATVTGLEGKTVWLEETKAPAGYNKLPGRVEVTFNNEGNDLATADFANPTVENKTGAELPSTGGMGTTTLYIVGGALVVAAGVTLVVRRRMNNEA